MFKTASNQKYSMKTPHSSIMVKGHRVALASTAGPGPLLSTEPGRDGEPCGFFISILGCKRSIGTLVPLFLSSACRSSPGQPGRQRGRVRTAFHLSFMSLTGEATLKSQPKTLAVVSIPTSSFTERLTGQSYKDVKPKMSHREKKK